MQDYLIALPFAATILGAAYDRIWLRRPLALVAGPVRWLAGATFPLYLLHYPVMVAIGSFLGHDGRHTLAGAGTMMVGAIVVSFIVAEMSERRKAWLQRALNSLREALVVGSRSVALLRNLSSGRRQQP